MGIPRARCLERRFGLGVLIASGIALALSAPTFAASPPASSVDLRTAANFAVLAGTPAITSAGTSTISGSLGISPAAGVTGFPPGKVVNGTIAAATPAAATAKKDLAGAYSLAAASPCNFDKTGQTLGGQTLTPGTYCQSTAPTLAGTITLSGDGIFIFQIGSTLVTAAGANIVLANGADACDVYWQVGSSATIGAATTFAGTLMAFTSITMGDGAHVNGRALAQSGQVTLINDTVTLPACAATPTLTATPTSSVTTGQPPCSPASCPTRVPLPLGGAATVTGPTPGAGSLASALGGSEPSVANVDMPLPVEAANLAPAPILDTHDFPWLWPLLIGLNLFLLMAVVMAVRRTNDPLPKGADPVT